MTTFVIQLLWLIVSMCGAIGVVVWKKEYLVRIAGTRQRRVIAALLLLVLQAATAIMLSSIDFGKARVAGALPTEDLVAFYIVIVLVPIGVAIEAFTILHADFAEQERAALSNERDLAYRDRDFQMILNKTFLGAVSRKRERLKKVTSIPDLVATLKPREQIVALVQICWTIVNVMMKDEVGPDFALRIAYFASHEGRLVLQHCYNGIATDCVSQQTQDDRRFSLDNPLNCLAVFVAMSGVPRFIPDTEAAAKDSNDPFVFFDKSERDKLKSIAAVPIKLSGDTPPHAVLVLDTNYTGFFSLDRQEQLDELVDNLAHRLQLEERIAQITGAG